MFDGLYLVLVLMASNNPGEGYVKSFTQPQDATRSAGSGPIYQQQQHQRQDGTFPKPDIDTNFSGPIIPTYRQYPQQQQQQQQRLLLLPQLPPPSPQSPPQQQQQHYQPSPNYSNNPQTYSSSRGYPLQTNPVSQPDPMGSFWHHREMEDLEKKNKELHKRIESLQGENQILSNRVQVILDYLQPQSKWSMQHIPSLDQLILELRQLRSPSDYDPILNKCEQISQVLNDIFHPKASTIPMRALDSSMVPSHLHRPTSEPQPRPQNPGDRYYN